MLRKSKFWHIAARSISCDAFSLAPAWQMVAGFTVAVLDTSFSKLLGVLVRW